ncbi:solute-binding protein (plasmid) [Pseudosulfitobacter pseudonitzschiae]|uniref:Solute-binding protein n=2 Tax=Pseudosulfitobacter pseudonitzschiae TaxID=1402135 RepID=A0A221K9V0_9RHOB|nr:solute-binding protein [Pseudosulfitobacter pseudonitzschiae]
MFFKTLAGIAFIGLAAGGALAETKLDMTNEYEPNSIHGQGDQFFADKVAELSGNDVIITLHLGGALGFKSKDNLDAVADGVVPIADTLGGVLAGSDPIFLVSSLPFMAANVEEARELYLAAKPAYAAFFEKNGQILLYASPWPPSGLWAQKPVDTPSALSGLKMRTYDANGTRTLIEAGASPIQLSWADVVPQLATGGIEGVLTSAEGGVNAKFWEHLSHFTEINYALPLNFVHMNRDAFDDLDEAGRTAILEAAAAADARNWEALGARVEGNYASLKENGVVIAEEISPELQAHLGAAASAVIAEWRKKTGEAGEAILSSYGAKIGRNF